MMAGSIGGIAMHVPIVDIPIMFELKGLQPRSSGPRVLQGKIPIYAPGVGVQGGQAALARKAGARYLIVGRDITLSSDPAKAAKKIASSHA
jgi:orotidine-5'-phosphate decarboxylase